MSKRNSQEAKRTARERLRVEREKQAKKEKVRRQLGVAGAVVAVLAVAAGIGFAVTNLNSGDDGSDWDAAQDAELVKPANASGDTGLNVVIGETDAEKTLEIYEDMRCPTCAAFEQASGEVVKKDLEEGKYKASFTMATFIDNMAPGTGSKNSLSALGAALDVSQQAFLDYKGMLYSAEYHPEESADDFADDDYLLDVAEEVDELKGNEEFAENVTSGTFDRWALEMSKKFDDSDVSGTPAFKMDGEKLTVEGAQEGTPIITPEQFNTAVDKALKG